MRLRHDDLARTIDRSAKRRRERSFDRLPAREAYDRWALVYDQQDNPLIALEERELPRLLPDPSGWDVLDVGCGTGRWTARLVASGARVTGLDFSRGMLARARQRMGADEANLIEHDLASPLPFVDGSYDLVLSALVMEHVGDLRPLFRELARVCRPAGTVVVSEMHPAMMLLDSQAEFRDPGTGRDVRPTSVAHQVSDFVMAALGAGLAVEHVGEYEVDEDLRQRSPRAAKFAGWPLLLLLIFRA
jgi:ubiquinone/menaquinone biosynthesis C-methylase UbiE